MNDAEWDAWFKTVRDHLKQVHDQRMKEKGYKHPPRQDEPCPCTEDSILVDQLLDSMGVRH